MSWFKRDNHLYAVCTIDKSNARNLFIDTYTSIHKARRKYNRVKKKRTDNNFDVYITRMDKYI